MFPGLFTAESGLLCAHSITLIARTVISIHVALLEGKVKFYHDLKTALIKKLINLSALICLMHSLTLYRTNGEIHC